MSPVPTPTSTTGQSASTEYVLDGGKVLLATANSQTTAYLYGLGVIGSQTDVWSYLLPDGLTSSRQLADASGAIMQATAYTPWGDTWAVNGASLAYGYLGGIMDTATGLIYVGNGQYYDPTTGRFLTRGVNPDQTNPYVPWQGDPTSLLISPLALLALVYTGKRKRSKLDVFVALMVVCGVLSLSLAGCGPSTPGDTTPGIVTPPPAEQPGQPGTEYPSIPTPGGTPIETPTPDCIPTPTPVSPSPFEGGYYNRNSAVDFALNNIQEGGLPTNWDADCTNFVSYALQAGNLKTTDVWKPDNPSDEYNPWVCSWDLVKFLTEELADPYKFELVTFWNEPIVTNDPEKKSYLFLRESDKWWDFVKDNDTQPGDIIAYHVKGYQSWSHLAIVVQAGNDIPLTHYLNDLTSPGSDPLSEPLIVDHSGPTTYLPRSMGDTKSGLIPKVGILHAPTP